MREKQGLGLFQVGVLLLVASVAVYLAVTVGALLLPFAKIAFLIGIILIIAGLVLPGRR
jgi:hypothetical protein